MSHHHLLEQLSALIQQRRLTANQAHSYVAQLNAKGLDKILTKVHEEALEVALASKEHQLRQTPQDRNHLVQELADLWFHLLVLMDHVDVPCQEIWDQLAQRLPQSGLTEKKNRASMPQAVSEAGMTNVQKDSASSHTNQTP